MILCGGRGTRLRERTREIPKPLIEIGGRPIVEHVIELYAAQGFRRFLLATGYRGELIERFVAARRWPEGVEVQCVDTGLDTPTGGRVKRLEGLFGGASPRSALTYADGLADIDLAQLLAFHEAHGALATITVVRPELQFGVAELDGEDGRVLGFREKPRSEHWINGGFLCLRPAALRYIAHDSVLEREPLQRLAADGPAARLPPRGLLGVHGHLQGCRRAQRPVGLGRGALARFGQASDRRAQNHSS